MLTSRSRLENARSVIQPDRFRPVGIEDGLEPGGDFIECRLVGHVAVAAVRIALLRSAQAVFAVVEVLAGLALDAVVAFGIRVFPVADQGDDPVVLHFEFYAADRSAVSAERFVRGHGAPSVVSILHRAANCCRLLLAGTRMERVFNSLFLLVLFNCIRTRNRSFDPAPRAGIRYGYPARQADALSWNSRAQGCFKGAGYPHRTPTPSQRVSVPCASTAHPSQPVDFNELLRVCRETVLLFTALWRMDRKRRPEPKCDFARPANRSILHDREQAGNATAATVSTCCAGPPLALRPFG